MFHPLYPSSLTSNVIFSPVPFIPIFPVCLLIQHVLLLTHAAYSVREND
jgi:hypothetical protein